MIDRFLRRLTVRSRIVGWFSALLLMLALALPLVVVSNLLLVNRVRQVADVEGRADRLLLLASTRLESSRVNLMRYVEDYAPSTYQSLDDVEQASQFLAEAQGLMTVPEQQAAVTQVLDALDDYQGLIGRVEAARVEGREQEVSRLLFEAYRLGNDIGQRIEQIVTASEAAVAAANEAIYTSVETLLIAVGGAYLLVLALGMVITTRVRRSITEPVAELISAAEDFRAGRLDTTIPVVGTDELSTLGQTFNQMAQQLRDLIGSLEERVADRTRELERRSAFLETSAEVGRAATLILDPQQLIWQIVELIRERFGLYYVGLFLLDETGEWAELRAGTGDAGRAMLARGHRIRVGEGMIGWSVAHAEARIALEAGEDAVRLATAELPLTRSEAALPLRSRGQVIGALTVQSDQPGFFDPATLVVLQTLADQVAVALSNARLFAESQTALEAMRRAYGEVSSQAWRQIVREQPDRGYFSDPRGIRAVHGPWRPEMIAAGQSGQAVRSDDGTLAVPVKAHGAIIGVVRLRKPNDAGEWTADEMAMMETLVEQLGVALDSARLYVEAQRLAARERLIGEISSRVRETLDIERVLQTAAREIYGKLELAQAEVWLGGVGAEEESGVGEP